MDPLLRAHQEWIGMAQPEGLVVTASVLHTAEANLTWPVTEQQAQLRELLSPDGLTVRDLRALLVELLGWPDALLIGRAEMPPELHAHIEGAGESPRPDFALRSAEEPTQFVILVCQIDPPSLGLDAATDDKRWTATPQQRCERLLRETGVPVGLLSNGRALRLIYAPKGESVGHVTFAIADLLSVDGRPLLGALLMLLSARRLLSLDSAVRLPALLQRSREYQNTVSNALREQVLGALRELLVGFQDADRLAAGQLLGNYRREHLQEVYTGLVTVLMRMVFVLYAEERGLLPMESPLYADSYSLTRLHAQLVEDRSRYGDGLDARYGAWARTLALFRILYDGIDAADGLHLPARRGDFFHPDRFPFLEGRPRGASRQVAEVLQLPKISDGVMFRVLDQLLLLGGERLQYRGLDVEQVGSVYEGLMGFEIEVAAGPSLCLSPQHVVVDLEQLLQKPAPERLKTLKEEAGLDAKGELGNKVKDATSIEALHQALGRRISPRQPGLLPIGSLYLQPGQERRRTGSHYTPRALTQPIVETALRPILERLGPDRTPAQLLGLKICDPAMGSGAFLVEACRQLADHLVTAWRKSGQLPELPPDEDLVLHARRLVAQRCLYGVDKNPLAADLARLSLWLVTFAREHPFTFVDHSLRCGDSLVGLSREQICSLTWLPIEKGIGNKAAQLDSVRALVDAKVKEAERLRGLIHAQGDPPDTAELFHLWTDARDAIEDVRLLGDVTVAAFFGKDTDKARKQAQKDLTKQVQEWLATGTHGAVLRGMAVELRAGTCGVTRVWLSYCAAEFVSG